MSLPVRSSDDADGTLIGREADLDRVGAFIAGVPKSGGPLLLMGEPGVGKTALLAAAVRRAEACGVSVLATAGVEYKARVSYAGVQQLSDAAAGEWSSIGLPGPPAGMPGRRDGLAPEPEAVVEALLCALRQMARGRPVLLVVDDSQWLDAASATVLGHLARRLDGIGAGLLCAARPGMESLFDHGGLPAHEVAPLSDSASEELLVRRFPALAPRVRRRLMAAAQGNPLALLELPVALSDSQRAASEALPERLPLSRRLQAAFAPRVTSLPAATRYLLLLAAMDGTGDLRVLRRAVADRCSLKHLAAAERVELIRVDDPSRLRFRHFLTRSAVVELATSDQRRSAHQALALPWRDVPERRAWHLAHAADAPDEQVAALLEQVAATIGARGDGPGSVAALLRAADLSPSGSEQARRLAKAACAGANITGDLREVPRLLDDARQAAPDADSMAAATAAAVYQLNGYGDIETAHRLLRGAIALQPEPYDLADATLLEAVSALLMVCVYGGRGELWADFDEVLSGCVSVPDTLQLLRTTFADPARARPADWARLDAAIEALPGTSDPVRIVRIGTAAAYADRLGAMEEPLRQTARGGRTGENNFPAIQASFLWGSHAWLTGQWPELRQVVRNGLSLCDEFHYPLRSFTGKFVLACVSAVCGDYATARGIADQMDQWAGSRRSHAVRCYAAHARTLIALSQGDFEDAYQHACAISPAGSLAPFAGHALWAILDLAEAAVRTGRREEALDHVRAARAAGLHEVSPRLNLVLLGSAALAAGSDAEAVLGFDEALSVTEAERWPFDLARIRLYYGERLRRGKAPAQARHQLRAAAGIFSRLGAAPWADRANQELRACGSPVRTASRSEGQPLTPQQWEIATLAAAGLSNKQIAAKLFLSPRTVSTHLYQLFPKLGITSRAALRDALEAT